MWLVVTSQEKLEEVVAAIDSKRVQRAKLTDRFSIERSFACRHPRSRHAAGIKAPGRCSCSRAAVAENQGLLNTSCQLERALDGMA